MARMEHAGDRWASPGLQPTHPRRGLSLGANDHATAWTAQRYRLHSARSSDLREAGCWFPLICGDVEQVALYPFWFNRYGGIAVRRQRAGRGG